MAPGMGPDELLERLVRQRAAGRVFRTKHAQPFYRGSHAVDPLHPTSEKQEPQSALTSLPFVSSSRGRIHGHIRRIRHTRHSHGHTHRTRGRIRHTNGHIHGHIRRNHSHN